MDESKDIKPRVKKPWPTKDVMSQIYARNLWGTGTHAFFSGAGSSEDVFVKPYLELVSQFLQSFKEPLVVCDLGCGDFNIGKDLVQYSKSYKAVDIVPELINYNRKVFTDEKLEFFCLDISMDTLPDGDCVILRQVLQHLSNEEVSKILAKLTSYKYIILTEHIPEGEFEPNRDIIAGQGTRLKFHSGVDIRATPFDFAVKSEKRLLTLRDPDNKGCIVTTLYEVG